MFNAIEDWKVAEREHTVSGIVVAHNPPHQSGYLYAFSVNSKKLQGSNTPSRGEFMIGEVVLVFFDPLDPTHNSLVSFRDSANGGFVCAAQLLFVVLALFIAICVQRGAVKGRANPRRSEP